METAAVFVGKPSVRGRQGRSLERWTPPHFLAQARHRVDAFQETVAQIGRQLQARADLLALRECDRPSLEVTPQQKSLRAMRKAHDLLVTRSSRARQVLQELAGVADPESEPGRLGLPEGASDRVDQALSQLDAVCRLQHCLEAKLRSLQETDPF